MRLILLIFIFLLSSCISPLEKGKIDISLKSVVNSKAKPEISNIVLENDQLKVSGSNFNNLKSVKINSQNLSVISNTSSELILSASSAMTLALNTVLNLVVETASGATSVAVTFNLVDGSVTASKIGDGEISANHLSSMGATSGQVMQYNGTTWVPTDLSGLIYLGDWDASTAAPAASIAGEYYIISNAGVTNLSGITSWSIGDWAIFDGTNWAKIDNSTGVKTFNGRSGVVTAQTNDYTWNQIDKSTSSLNDIADVDTTGASVNDVLKWDGSKWIVAPDETVSAGSVTTSAIADGTITNADIDAAAAISASKISGLSLALTQVSTNTSDISSNTSDIATNATAISTNASNISTNATSIAGHTTSISNLGSAKVDKTITVNGQALNSNVSLDSDDIAQGGVNLYFSDTLARTAAVIDSMAGAQTNQAPSVDAVKNYISTQTSAITSSQWQDSGSDIYFNAGKVGIGTNTPELELEVVGGISFLNSVGASIPADSILVMKSCPTGWTDIGATGTGPASAICDGVSCRRCQSPTNSTAVPSSAILLFEQCPTKWTYLSKGAGPGAAGFNMPYSACQAPATTAVLPLGSKIIAESCPSQWNDLGETQTGPLIAGCGAGNCHICEVPGSVTSSIVQTNSDILSLQPNSGNVGIGIFTPTAKLDVFDGLAQVTRIENDSTSRGHYVFKRGDGLGANASINTENTGSNDVSALTFHIASTERMRIRNDGRVIASSFQGDGSNLTGVALSDNSGDINFSNAAVRNINMDRATSGAGGNIAISSAGAQSGATDTNGGNLIFSSGTSTGTGSSSIDFKTASPATTGTSDNTPTTKMTLAGDGKLGLGSTTPLALLHIVEPDDTWNSSIRMDRSWDSSTDYFQMMYDYEGLKIRTMADGTDEAHIIFKPKNSEAMRITEDGVLIPSKGFKNTSIFESSFTNAQGLTTGAAQNMGELYQNATTFSGDNGATAKTLTGIFSNPRISNDGSGGTAAIAGYGIRSFPIIESSGAAAQVLSYGVIGQAVRGSATDFSSSSSNNLIGGFFSASHGVKLPGTASTENIMGLQASSSSHSGTITNMASILESSAIGYSTQESNTQVTNKYGIWLKPFTVGGSATYTSSVTNNYGIYLGAASLSTNGSITNNYSIFQEDAAAKNYFAGNIGVGTTTPSAKLDVNGDAHFSNMTFYDTSVSVPMASYVPINLSSASPSLVDGNIYRIQLNVTSTATKTGAAYIVYQTAPATWALKQVSANGDTSNHPLLRINVAGTGLEVFHNHSSTYSIHAAVKTVQTGNIDNTSPTYFGLEGVISNYTGNIGIGTDLPKQKLHISGANSSQVVRIDNTDSTVARYPQFQTVNYRGATGAGSGAFSFYNSNGSIDTPSAMLQNEQVGIITAYARGTTSFVKSSEIIFGTAENISDTSSAGNIRFLTTDVGAVDPTEKMRVTDTGKIGVGTNAPIEKLHVSGGNIRITSNTTMTSPGVSGGLQIFNSQSANNDYLNIGWVAEDIYAIQSADASTYKNFSLNPYGGNVGIGTIAPAQKLDVYGNIAVSGSTVHTSDKRFKKDIKVIDHALSKIRKLNGVEFVWRTEEFRERNFKEGLDVGLIAQNVLDVFPEVVEQDANGYYSVAYSKLIGPVIEATKELDHNLEVYKLMSNGLEKKVESNSREIASLKEENENLQKKVESLEERILRLEKLLSR